MVTTGKGKAKICLHELGLWFGLGNVRSRMGGAVGVSRVLLLLLKIVVRSKSVRECRGCGLVECCGSLRSRTGLLGLQPRACWQSASFRVTSRTFALGVMCRDSAVTTKDFVLDVLESTTTSRAAEKVAVGLGVDAVWTLFNDVDRLIRRIWVSRIVSCVVSCVVRGQGCVIL